MRGFLSGEVIRGVEGDMMRGAGGEMMRGGEEGKVALAGT